MEHPRPDRPRSRRRAGRHVGARCPARLFEGGLGTTLIGTLPWVLIPAFIVPLLALTHIAVYGRVTATAPVGASFSSAVAAPREIP